MLAGMPLRASTLVALACILGGGCSIRPAMEFEPPIPCRITAPRKSAFFLIADAGKPVLSPPDAADPNVVIVVGDNVYPAGMLPPGEKGPDLAARILDAQIAAIGEARGFFTLSNHDWVQRRRRGWANAKAQVVSVIEGSEHFGESTGHLRRPRRRHPSAQCDRPRQGESARPGVQHPHPLTLPSRVRAHWDGALGFRQIDSWERVRTLGMLRRGVAPSWFGYPLGDARKVKEPRLDFSREATVAGTFSTP